MSFHHRLMRSRTRGAALIGLLLFPAVLSWLSHKPGLEQLDMLVYDRVLPLAAPQTSGDILIVAIDETSLAELGSWPWPRETHARLLDRLADAGARCVMLDLLLIEPSVDAAQDRILAQAMTRLPVYLPLQANRTPRARVEQNAFLAPVPPLKERAKGVGHVELILDTDGIARSLFMGLGPPGEVEPYIGLVMAGRPPPSTSITSDAAGWRYTDSLRILFAGPQGSYRTVPYVHVLRGDVAPDFLRDKIVLVGSTTAGLGDQVVAPLAGHAETIAGVEIHANVIDQLMHHRAIQAPGWVGTYVWIGFPLWLLAWLLWRREGTDLIVVVAMTIGWALLSMASLYGLQWWLGPATPAVGLLALYLIWSWGRQRSQLRYLQQRAEHLKALPSGAFELPLADLPQARHASPSNRALDLAISRMVGVQVLADSTIQSMPVGVLLCDAQGRIVGCNDAARELLSGSVQSEQCESTSLPPAEQYLVKWLQLMQPQSRALAQVSGTPPTWIGQIHAEYMTKDHRHVQLLVASVTPPGIRTPSGYLVVLADLTSERRAQQQRERWHRFLSHDLRNPQANILALIELESINTGEGVSPLASAIRREAMRTLALAENFLDTSHAWAGNYRFAPAHMGALLLDARDQVLAYATRKDVKLVLNVSEDDEEIELNVDAALLARAITNLLSNAIRHSLRGGRVQLCMGANVHEVAIAVSDSGEGMSESFLQRLLSAAHESSVGRSSGEAGVRSRGLGFEFVRTVIARHGGMIDGHAAPEFGATFWFSLPRT